MNTVNDFLKLPANILDIPVTVTIDGTVREISTLLSLIMMGEQLGIIDESDLSSIYGQIFDTISLHGHVVNGDDFDE